MEPSVPIYSWTDMLGAFEHEGNSLTFKGVEYDPPAQEITGQADSTKGEAAHQQTPPKRVLIGRSICNQQFKEGRIKVGIEFDHVDFRSMADIVIQYDPSTEEMLDVSLGGGTGFYSLRWFTFSESEQTKANVGPLEKKWQFLRWGGDRTNLKPNRTYEFEVLVRGSSLILVLDGVEILAHELPFQLPGFQVGVFCAGMGDIRFSNFTVEAERPQAFVVMQFNTPEYEALFSEVIKPVCEREGFRVYRADFTQSPGLVIADITARISESRVIVAEITPLNGNVYYEVGYADALRKPVILIADSKAGSLPFDVRPYRTIFYENSIGGKNKVESALAGYLKSILSPRGGL